MTKARVPEVYSLSRNIEFLNPYQQLASDQLDHTVFPENRVEPPHRTNQNCKQPMVDETTTTATTTTTASMLELSTHINTTATQKTVVATIGSFHHQHSTSLPSVDSSDDESNYQHISVTRLCEFEDSDHDFLEHSNESATLRLPSGKTIGRKAEGPHTSRHRHWRTPSPNTKSHNRPAKKVQGNCAIISDPTNLKTATPVGKLRQPLTPPTSDEEGDRDHTTLISQLRSSQNTLVPHIRRSAHRTTTRESDAQMLATLPASTQRTLLATSKKAVEGARRQEQEYRGKLDGYGNLKSKDRFVNDVPGGKSHKNRFMAQ